MLPIYVEGHIPLHSRLNDLLLNVNIAKVQRRCSMNDEGKRRFRFLEKSIECPVGEKV